MSTLSQNILRATNDFDEIRDAIIEKGIEVPEGTPTSEYADKILQKAIAINKNWNLA